MQYENFTLVEGVKNVEQEEASWQFVCIRVKSGD